MQCKDLLKWVLGANIEPTGINWVEIKEEDQLDFMQTFFGEHESVNVPAGEYMYVWGDCVGEESLAELCDLCDPIVLKLKDDDVIYLIKMD